MKSKTLRTLVFVALQALWPATLHAADADGSKFSDEFVKQDRIYRARGAQALDGYVTDRSLSGYATALPAAFERDLASLGPADRWLDVAGEQQRQCPERERGEEG